MSLPDPRLHTAMQAAVQKILSTVSTTSSQVVDALGMLALSAKSNAERQAYMAAQFDLQRGLSSFNMTFSTVLNEKVAQELNPRLVARGPAATNWASLSLVGDSEVEEHVTAHRLALAIAHTCEWELRELDAYMGSLLGLERADPDRNPIRPDVLGKALFRAIEAASPDMPVRKTLAGELGHGLAKAMRTCYGEIVNDFGARGIQPAGLGLRSRAGHSRSIGLATHGADAPTEPAGLSNGDTSGSDAVRALSAMFGMAAPGGTGHGAPLRTASGTASSFGSGFGPTVGPGGAAAGRSPGPGPAGEGMGHGSVSDAQLVEVIRRLAFLSSAPATLDPRTSWGSSSTPLGMTGSTPLGGSTGAGSSGLGGLMAVNLIRTHREELMRASSGTLDHMVIDIVASLFDQILSDSKVPPQMARQIARLQLPVLRVALKDVQFFSSRNHPVRKFVNRMATLACAFEDFSEGTGKRFLDLVRELVQQVVEGDFDQMELYEAQLRVLESFVQEQTRDEALVHAGAVQLLTDKEAQLRIQTRYEQQMQALLLPIAMQDFLRDFLHTTWSRVVVEATLRHGAESEISTRMRRTARDLILSVQPKGTPAERKQFILALPQLMKTLNEGLAMIRWPEDRKKAFFGELLPCHAQSLKGQALTDFQLRQLEVHLQALERQPVPSAGQVAEASTPAALADSDTAFSQEEAQQLGFIDEAAIDWNGSLDIDLGSLDAAPGALDINLDGLGPELTPETPTKGVQLAQCVQAGIAYQMHTEEGWIKVRLNWVSPGRSFFIFSHGKKHQKIISLTGRTFSKLCETGRFKAFEQAYLIERAVARARRQLAELSANSKS